MRHIRSRAALSALPLALTGVLAMGASPAAAATVNGCAQGWSEYPGTCIWVETGGKNSADHTQWVASIKVQAPRGAGSSKMEAWAGNGPTGVAWYNSGNGTSFTWTINKWIKTKSGICGAYTWTDGSGRSIACITITA